MNSKKIVIAGGTGFIGRAVAKYFSAANEIVILTRNTKATNNALADLDLETYPNVRLVHWNGKDVSEWGKELNGTDIVINLAGRSVNCRYNEKNREEIFDSRVNATKAIAEAIRQSVLPPKLWINAASATIYRHSTDRPQDEFTGEYHDDFSVQVCKLWEKTFFEERTPFTRKVAFRMAITLGTGGVMVPYLTLCKFGLGGKQGNGKQMYSWVHIEDVCRTIEWMWDHTGEEGVYNVSSPNPVANKVFMQTVRSVTGNLFGLPAFEWMLKIGAAVIGTETELLLKSRWVLPAKLLQKGFRFRYPVLEDAVRNIVSELPKKKYRLFK
jgi:uncharacterized protein